MKKVGSNSPTANKIDYGLKAKREQALREKFKDNPFNLNAVNEGIKQADAGKMRIGHGWGKYATIHNWEFRGKPKFMKGGSYKRPELEDKEVRTGSTAGSLTRGTSKLHQAQLQGPRISHIGNQSATVATTMLKGLATGQSKTGTIFQQPNFKSRARALGRPLGYGTVYKFI